MTYRERLIEVMARGIRSGHGVIYEGGGYPNPDVLCQYWIDYASNALAAAERAGFEFRKKEIDGE